MKFNAANLFLATIFVRNSRSTTEVKAQLEMMESSHVFQEQSLNLIKGKKSCYVCSIGFNKGKEQKNITIAPE